MKKLLLLMALSAIFLSCSTRESKTKSLIKDYLSKTLDDASSYEAVEFSQLDSAMTSYISSDEYSQLFAKQEAALDRANELSNSYPMTQEAIDSANIYLKIQQDCSDSILKQDDNFKGQFKGWKMIHSFRAKNKLGAKVISKMMFFFDKDLTKITYATKTEE